MNIIIIGAGQVGSSMTEILAGESNNVTLIDVNHDILQNLQDRLDINTVHGSGAYPSILEQAGCNDADLVLAVTDRDEINMVASQIAHTMFNTPRKIARIRSREYINFPKIFSKDAIPVDVIISPEEIVTAQILRVIEHPGALQVVDFANGKIQLVAVRAYDDGPLVGHEIKELRNHMPNVDTRVAAIYRKDRPIYPQGDTIIEPDDEVFFIAARENIRHVIGELRKLDDPVKRIMLVGAGNIGFRLASELERRNYHIKLIENNLERASEVSEMLQGTVVLRGDAADEELLRQENIENTEVFCTLTNDDEVNILSAMLAKKLGAARVMPIINRSAYVDLIEDNVLDIVFSPKVETVGSLLTHIRRGDVVAVHSLRRGAAEAIEAIAHGDRKTSKVVGRTIDEINLPAGTTLGAIARKNKVIIAHHDTVIEAEDHLILFVIDKRHIHAVESLFQVAVTFI